jgi:hypothetical protein
MNEQIKPRAFKTEWFAKAAKKADISDADLCKAIEQVRLGQCDDLGGGVFKKRLNKNMHRSIMGCGNDSCEIRHLLPDKPLRY